MYYVFSFGSRNGALKFYDTVTGEGVRAKLVNTPISGSGCGLSVKCDDYERCRSVLARGGFPAFINVYSFDGQKYTTIFD